MIVSLVTWLNIRLNGRWVGLKNVIRCILVFVASARLSCNELRVWLSLFVIWNAEQLLLFTITGHRGDTHVHMSVCVKIYICMYICIFLDQPVVDLARLNSMRKWLLRNNFRCPSCNVYQLQDRFIKSVVFGQIEIRIKINHFFLVLKDII